MAQVGARELEGTGERAAPFKRDHRHDQSGESQPDHGRQHAEEAEEAEEHDRGNQCDGSERRSFGKSPARYPLSGHDSGRERERETCGRRPRRERKRQSRDPRRLRERQARGRGSDTERKGTPETAPVEANRLGDQLADRTRRRR